MAMIAKASQPSVEENPYVLFEAAFVSGGI